MTPTSVVNLEGYLSRNADLRSGHLIAYEHLVKHGIYEGRLSEPAETPQLVVTPPYLKGMAGEVLNWHKFWSVRGYGAFADCTRLAGDNQAMIADTLGDPAMRAMLQRAVSLEPGIGPIRALGPALSPPYHDPREFSRRMIRARLQHDTYDTIVCMPWLRTGGADLVACMVADTMQKRNQGRVLLLRTDHDAFERPDWVPAGVECIDISAELGALGETNAEFLLYGLTLRLRAKRVINVNSRRCWMMLKRFGQRIRDRVNIYSYLFCWDQTRDGARVGYPSEFFPETAHLLHCTFTDSDYLRSELAAIYRPPAEVMERVKALYTPALSDPFPVTVAEQASARRNLRSRPRILWSGRLDWQKRFDIVQQIAERMPDVDFVAWGKSIIGDAPPMTDMPPNLTLHERFNSFDDLPLADSELWLFTSAWEGMPTTLIELAVRGAPVVASSVGAVPELIDEMTGWPVHDIENPAAYVAAIREALSNDEERTARARRLCERGSTRYVASSYAAQLEEVFARETPS